MPPINAQIGSHISVTIAASSIALSIRKIEEISIQNQLVGTVSEIQHMGTRTLVSVDIGAELIVEITAKALLEMRIGHGSTVYCLIKTQSIHTFPVSTPRAKNDSLPQAVDCVTR